MAGLFFAIGHEPATKFLDGQVRREAHSFSQEGSQYSSTAEEGGVAERESGLLKKL